MCWQVYSSSSTQPTTAALHLPTIPLETFDLPGVVCEAEALNLAAQIAVAGFCFFVCFKIIYLILFHPNSPAAPWGWTVTILCLDTISV